MSGTVDAGAPRAAVDPGLALIGAKGRHGDGSGDPDDVEDPTAPRGRRRPATRAAQGASGATAQQISQVPYLPGLDGMRAIAVVAVMVYHANSSWLEGGYLGVEVFFVISGYLITLLLIAEHERTGEVDLKGFWVRRFRRLLPAVFVMMLLLSVWVALFERDELGKLRGDVIAGATYITNWYQIWIGAGYSAGNDFAPLRHLWSLAVEEQFYIIWPLIMLAFVRSGPRRIAGVARWLFLGAIAITVMTALLDYNAPQQTPEFTPDAYWMIGDRAISKPDALYLSTITRAGGLMLGAAFAMVWRPTAVMRGPLRNKARILDGAALLGFVGLAVMSVLISFKPSEGVHGFLFKGGLFLTGIATLAIIAAVTHRASMTGRLLAHPVLNWIGTRSYGLYLYHWPIFQIIRNIAANKLAFHEFVLAMVATCILTEISYRYIETPIRKGKLGELWRRRGSASTISDGQRKAATFGIVAALGLTVFAGASMATAELRQNDVAEILDENAALRCDLVTGENCDGASVGDEQTATDPGFVEQEQGGEQPLPGAEGGVDPAGDPAADPGEGSGGVVVPDSTTTVPAPVAATRFAIGDSVMLGALQPLQQVDFKVDAIESRAWINGLDVVETLERNGNLPDELVIHLGTNGPISQANMDRMLVAVSDVPKVVMLTNDVDRDYTADNNALIYDAAARLPNVHVLDWQGLVTACPGECLYDDGFHLRPEGQTYYAALIDEFLGSLPTT